MDNFTKMDKTLGIPIIYMPEVDDKPHLEPIEPMCRCCLATRRPMNSATSFASLFENLVGISVSTSDGLPQYVCYECTMKLQRSVRFQQQVLHAHNLLYDYMMRCAPFPLDSQDPELAKYTQSSLSATSILSFDNKGKSKLGYHKLLQHKKVNTEQELNLATAVLPAYKQEDDVKEELGFSDYEDNIPLEEYRSNPKLPDDAAHITEDELEQLLVSKLHDMTQETEVVGKKRGRKKKEVKKKEGKKERVANITDEKPTKVKNSIRKPVDLDPSKIRVITLNPEEQIKQREEESKANNKFPFQCHLCFKGFNFESKLQNHMSKHSPSRGKFSCSICSMHLPTCYSHSVHMLIHTRRYECVACGRRMIDRASIMEHYQMQHEGVTTVYTCDICGKSSNNSKTYRSHMRNHHSGDRPKCDLCGKTFINKDSLTEHMQIHAGVKNYSCGECGMRFRTRTQIKHHQLKHTNVKQYYCVECDIRFKSQHSLRQHLLKSLRHKDKATFEHVCAICDKRFERASVLEHHTRVQHLGVRAHRCPRCPARLATRNSLGKHQRAVHDQQRAPPSHVCHTCGKLFRGKSVLINHVRTHTGEKPFDCPECGRKFTQHTALRTHIKLVHLKIRNNKIKPETTNPPIYVKDQLSGVYEPCTWNRTTDYISAPLNDATFKMERT